MYTQSIDCSQIFSTFPKPGSDKKIFNMTVTISLKSGAKLESSSGQSTPLYVVVRINSTKGPL